MIVPIPIPSSTIVRVVLPATTLLPRRRSVVLRSFPRSLATTGWLAPRCGAARWSTASPSPRWRSASPILIAGAAVVFDLSGCSAATNLVHELVVVLVDGIPTWTARWTTLPASTGSTIRTVARHVTCIPTSAADNAGGEVAGLGAVVLTVTNLAAVLASLVFVIAEGAVEGCKLAKLVALELILSFGDGSGLK